MWFTVHHVDLFLPANFIRKIFQEPRTVLPANKILLLGAGLFLYLNKIITLSYSLNGMNWHKMATKFLYADIFWHQNFLYVKFLCVLIFCVSHFCCLYEWPKLSICGSMSQFESFVVNNFLAFVDNFYQWWQKLTSEVFFVNFVVVKLGHFWPKLKNHECQIMTFVDFCK